VAEEIEWFVGIDWTSQSHQVCLVDARGECLGERAVAHGGAGIEELCDWLIARTGATPEVIGVAIEMTHGPVVEALLERGFCVYGINPEQLDRFRDRFTVAGATDDRRDAHVLADSLRTDRHAFRRLSNDPIHLHPSTFDPHISRSSRQHSDATATNTGGRIATGRARDHPTQRARHVLREDLDSFRPRPRRARSDRKAGTARRRNRAAADRRGVGGGVVVDDGNCADRRCRRELADRRSDSFGIAAPTLSAIARASVARHQPSGVAQLSW